MFLNVIFAVNGCDAVPVRAVPHLTGGYIGPLGIAQLLADPNHQISAYAWSKNAAPTKLLPKNWNQFKAQLATPGQQQSDVANLQTTATLPASIFVYLADLQRAYEDYYLPPRGDLAAYTAAEREDFQLQPLAFIPDDLIDLVIEGFSVPLGIPLPAGSQPTFPSPSVGATAAIPAAIQLPAAVSRGVADGTSLKWTPERKSEARAMLANEKASGVKDYAARTAKAFGVSTPRLRKVLCEDPKKVSSKKSSLSWPPSNL